MAVFFTSAVPQGIQAQTLTRHKPGEAAYLESRISYVFNKFRYDMVVEWYQRDPYFRQRAEKELEISLLALKSEGVSEKIFLNSWRRVFSMKELELNTEFS